MTRRKLKFTAVAGLVAVIVGAGVPASASTRDAQAAPDASAAGLRGAAGTAPASSGGGATLPTGPKVDLAVSRDGQGVGYTQYRIPAMVVTRDGTIVASYDGRRTTADLPSHIDNLVRISRDGGATWEDQRVNRAGPYPMGYGDPALAYNPQTNRIFLAYAISTTTGFFAGAVGNDEDNPKVVQHGISWSDDDGRTWHHDVITDETKGADWGGTFASSGRGLYVSSGPYKGRVMFQYNLLQGGQVKAASAWTDDNGATWHHGQPTAAGTNENKVVDMSDGRLRLDVRSKPYRLTATSEDGGQTWGPLSQVLDRADPNDNGSTIRLYPGAAQSDPRSRMMLATGNDDMDIRRNVSVKLSCDNGHTWPISHVLEEGSSAYSTADVLPNGDVAVLYERDGYDKITFTTIKGSDLAGLCAPMDIPAGSTLTPGETTTLPVTVTNQSSDAIPAGQIAIDGVEGVSGSVDVPALPAGTQTTVALEVATGDDVAPQTIRPLIRYTADGRSSQLVRDLTVLGAPGVTETVLSLSDPQTYDGTRLTDLGNAIDRLKGLDNGSIAVTFNTTAASQTLPQVLFAAADPAVDDHELLLTINSGARPYFEIRPSRAQGYLANYQSQVAVNDGKDHTVTLTAQDGHTIFSLDGTNLYTANTQAFFSSLPRLANATVGGVRFKTAKQSATTDQWFFDGTVKSVTVTTTRSKTVVTPKPALSIEPVLDVYKYTNPPALGINDQASYMVRIRNTGNVTLRNLTADGNLDLAGCTAASLAPGASVLCRDKRHTFTQADVDAHGYTLTMSGTAAYTDATGATKTVTAMASNPQLALPMPYRLPDAPQAVDQPVANCAKTVLPVKAVANTEENIDFYGREDTAASKAVDGDPATFWSTGWSVGTGTFPNWITLDLGKPMPVCGLNYTPRQGNTNGNVGAYRIYVSNDPDQLGEPVAGGTFEGGNAAQVANLPGLAVGRYVRLVSYEDVGQRYTQTTTAAELSVNVAGSANRADLVIPKPTTVTTLDGKDFTLGPDTRIVADAANLPEGHYLTDLLRPATGFDLTVTSDRNANGRNTIRLIDLTARNEKDPSLGTQGYRIDAAQNHVDIAANTREGAFNGIQTLRQLLPPQVSAHERQDQPWTVSPVTIRDTPRFAYRGAMLDTGRRFYPVKDVKRFLDHMAQYKLNGFHFHLTEDQGWRIAIDAYPALTQVGGSGQSGIDPGTVDNGVAGPWFYTKDQFREIVEYARARHIQVIPEIDGPGHTGAAMASIPNLNCDDTSIPVYTEFHRGPNLCLKDAEHLTNVGTYLAAVVKDVAGQTPTTDYFHLGGDESAGLTDDQFTAYTKIGNDAVAAVGKKVIGWNSWADGEPLPAGAVLQNYGQEDTELNLAANVKTALDNGNQVLMSPSDHTYLDIKYDASTPYGLTWIQGRYLDLARAYRWEPNTVTPDPSGHGRLEVPDGRIFGVELALWADATNQNGTTTRWSDGKPFDPVSSYMDTMLFPRLPAVAEVAWSAKADRRGDPQVFLDFQNRVIAQSKSWTAAGVGWFHAPDVPWR